MYSKPVDNRDTHSSLTRAELAFQVATMYYEQGKPQKVIAEELKLGHNSAVSRLLKFAREAGIVRIEIRPEFGVQPKRDRSLETKLIQNFDLDNAIVVSRTGYESGFDATEDEKLHVSLGVALAERLRTMLRAKDHIGVTGGRGTYYTARALSAIHPPALKHKGIVIISLTGNVTTITSASKTIDADDVAHQLSLGFENAELRRLSLPVAVTSKRVKEELFAKGQGMAISPKLWRMKRVPVPNIAILGIGVLDDKSKHRFLNLEGFELQPIKSQLLQLREKVRTAKYCPVGDIGYRLFYIEPPSKSVCLPQQTIAKIKRIIDSLNCRLLCIDEEQLRMVDTRIVIGGGPLKVSAIRQILDSVHPAPLIHELCTDERTARALLAQVPSRSRRGF